MAHASGSHSNGSNRLNKAEQYTRAVKRVLTSGSPEEVYKFHMRRHLDALEARMITQNVESLMVKPALLRIRWGNHPQAARDKVKTQSIVGRMRQVFLEILPNVHADTGVSHLTGFHVAAKTKTAALNLEAVNDCACRALVESAEEFVNAIANTIPWQCVTLHDSFLKRLKDKVEIWAKHNEPSLSKRHRPDVDVWEFLELFCALSQFLDDAKPRNGLTRACMLVTMLELAPYVHTAEPIVNWATMMRSAKAHSQCLLKSKGVVVMWNIPPQGQTANWHMCIEVFTLVQRLSILFATVTYLHMSKGFVSRAGLGSSRKSASPAPAPSPAPAAPVILAAVAPASPGGAGGGAGAGSGAGVATAFSSASTTSSPGSTQLTAAAPPFVANVMPPGVGRPLP